MLRSYLEAIILRCLYEIKEERTVYSVYHLLNGKKSSQTIQDGHLYKISKYFRTDPSITREKFQHIITYFCDNGFIHIVDNEKGSYQFTINGEEALTLFERDHPKLSYLNGIQYHMLAPLLWKRFSLLFQVISNGIHSQSKYYCVQRDLSVQNWVKTFLYHNKNMKNVAAQLYHELFQILSQLPDNQAQIFVLKLSGYERIGYSNSQIANHLDLEEEDVHYYFVNALHFLMLVTSENSRNYPLLHSIYKDELIHHTLPVTQSSLITLRYLKQGLSIDEIAVIRNLKTNTIEDHIVELALHTNEIDVSVYVSDTLIDEIQKATLEVKTKQLRQLKHALSDRVSYFQIRLALIKGGLLS